VRRGGASRPVALAEEPIGREETALMSEVAEAIESLAKEDPRGAKVVELPTFGGLTMDEIASHLEVSKPTVERDWRFCRAWLERRLASEIDEGGEGGPSP
jgi:DNA-directed RNA polymerase specialized sigma24 family protein